MAHTHGLRYLRCWEPVLAAPGERLIEEVARSEPASSGHPADAGPGRAAPARTILDLGTGSGGLAVAAARRWPAARVIGLDASAAMLSAARYRAAGRDAERLEWLLADAAAVPLADATVDIVLTGFMLQLVPDRLAVLREAGRLLRPGGHLGLVGWLQDDARLAPDEEFDEAVYDLRLEEPEGARAAEAAGDFEDPDEAAADLTAAGFEAVRAWPEQLAFAWTREAYLDFKERFDEAELFDALSAADRCRLRERLRLRWSRLPDDAFVLRAPVVMATARHPG
jgi:SAM-dependent methyltransferase